MSEIRVTTLSDAAGTGPSGLTAQIAPKASCDFSTSVTVVNSLLNFSSGTDNGVGDYTLTVTNAFDQSIAGLPWAGNAKGSNAVLRELTNGSTASAINIQCQDTNDTNADSQGCCTIWGNLA